jgi:hypothetical protein
MNLRARRIAVLVGVLALGSVLPVEWLRAQALPTSLSDLQYRTNFEVSAARLGHSLDVSDSTKHPRTYWLEGALIGGIPLALLGAALGGGLCSDPDNAGGGTEPCWDDALLGLMIGFGVGGSLGGLIGGLIKKPEKNEQEAPAE